jgi:acetoin:2,6-dichlorophenolindophenol oxidoreductase subunit beta
MFTQTETAHQTPAKQDMRLIRYVDALREAFESEMERDPSVFLYGLDVDDHKGIQGSTLGLLEKFGKDRVWGTPLSEDAMTGVGIGAAISGYRPIHTHIRMDFMLLCMNQIVNMAAKMHYMYNGQVKVPMVIRTMIGRSWGQGGQHSQAFHSLFMHIPGLKVVAPANAHDAKGCMIAAIRDNNPVIFIEHRLLYSTEGYVPAGSYEVQLGQARTLVKGDDVTIVAMSHMVMEALRAKEHLATVGIHAEVIDPVTLWPLDMDTIMKSAQRTGRLLIVDNAWLTCGASSEIMTRAVEMSQQEGRATPVLARMGFAPTTCPTTRPLENLFYPNGRTIAAKAYEMVKGKSAKAWEPPADANTEIDAFKGPF